MAGYFDANFRPTTDPAAARYVVEGSAVRPIAAPPAAAQMMRPVAAAPQFEAPMSLPGGGAADMGSGPVSEPFAAAPPVAAPAPPPAPAPEPPQAIMQQRPDVQSAAPIVAPRPRGPSPLARAGQMVDAYASAAAQDAADAQDRTDQALGAQIAAKQEESAAAADYVEKYKATMAKWAEQADRIGAQQMAEREAEKRGLEQSRLKWESADREAKDVQVKDSRTTGQRVVGALAIVASGIATGYSGAASALAGTQKTNYINQTIDIINAGIERDLALQREAAKAKRERSDKAFSEYQIASQHYDAGPDRDRMALALHQAKYEPQLRALEKQYEGTAAGAIAGGAAAQIAANVSAAREEAARAEAARARDASLQFGVRTLERQQARQDAAAAGARPMSERERLELEGKALDNAKKRLELEGIGAGGSETDVPGYERTKDVAPAQATMASTLESIRSAQDYTLRRLKDLRARNAGKATWSAADAREGDELISSLADRASQLAGGGQAGEAAKQAVMERVANPTDVSMLSDPAEAYEQIRQSTNAAVRARMEALGYRSIGAANADEAAQIAASQGEAR